MSRVGAWAMGSFAVGLVALALPWKVYLLELRGGNLSPSETYGAEVLEALLISVLLAPVGILGAVIFRRGRGTFATLVPLLVFAGLASACGILTLILLAVDPKWHAGIGCYVQVVGALVAIASGIVGLVLHIKQ